MKKLFPISLILNIALLLIILLQRECGHSTKTEAPKTDTVTITRDSIRHDTLTMLKIIPMPEPDTVYLSQERVRDTLAALDDYNLVKIYDRLLWDDNYANIRLIDTLFRNALKGYRVKAEFYKHDTTRYITKIITTQPNPPRAKWFVGLQAGMILPDKAIAAPTIALLTKREHLYTLGYDPVNKAAVLGFMWKIRIREPP